MSDIVIPLANPLRFVLRSPNALVNDQDPDYQLYEEEIHDGIDTEPYYVKVQSDDPDITVYIESQYTTNTLNVYKKSDDSLVQTLSQTELDTNKYLFVIDVSALANDVYYAKITGTGGPVNDYEAESEPFKVAANHRGTILITYSNYDDAYDIQYVPASVQFNLRIEGYIKDRIPHGSQDLYMDDAGIMVKLNSLYNRGIRLKTVFLPDYLHEIVRLALEHDEVLINNIKIQTTEGYSWENVDDDTKSMGTANLQRVEPGFINRHDNNEKVYNKFISDWNTANTSTGSSGNTQVKLPLISAGVYNFTVEWGDGTKDVITTWNQSEVTHTYASSGTYEITIYGLIKGWRFQNTGDRLKITDIKQWGGLIVSGDDIFRGCGNLTITATDVIDLSKTSTMYRMFGNCTSITTIPSIDEWDVSGILTMEAAFQGCTNFNDDMNSWDVSNVTTFDSMFNLCSKFNGNITSWDVSAATNFASMFEDAAKFNQDISGWTINTTVSAAINMNFLFDGCTDFNQDISAWDVSEVIAMRQIFRTCTSFNQNLNAWDTGKVTTLYRAFNGCTIFNQPLDGWDVSSCVTMEEMFLSCPAFNQSLNSWVVTAVTTMQSMFEGCTNYNGNITSWTPTSCLSFRDMFRDATSFNQNIGSWTFASSGSISMIGMLRGCTAFNQDISGWSTTQVTSMASMFNGSTAFDQDISSWDTGNVTSFNGMFAGATSFDQDLGSWDVTSLLDATSMFNSVTLSTANYDALLVGWEAQAVNNNVVLSGGNSTYTSAGAGGTSRAALIADHSWTITDGGGI